MSDEDKNKFQGTVFGYTTDYFLGKHGFPPRDGMDMQYVAGAINGHLQRQRKAAAEKEEQEAAARRRASPRRDDDVFFEVPILAYIPPLPFVVPEALLGAKIKKVRVDHDVQRGGEKGMVIHTDFTAYNVKTQSLRIVAFLYHDDPGFIFRGKRDGRAVKTSASGYQTRNGNLCAWKDDNAPYEATRFEDTKLFLPYYALPQDELGRHKYKFEIQVRSNQSGQTLGSSEMISFSHTVSPEAEIDRVWTDHNIVRNNRSGMLIHADFWTGHLKGEELEVIAFFRHDSDWKSSPIKADRSANADFRMTSGELCVSRDCVPSYKFSHFSDLDLFLPHSVLPREKVGQHKYKFDVQVRSKQSGRAFASSETQHFSHTVSPGAEIDRVWTDHNVVRDGQKGMLIHTEFGTNHLEGTDLEVIAFFHQDSNRKPSPVKVSKSISAAFRTVSDDLCVAGRCTPRNESAKFDDFELFLPYRVIPQEKTGTHHYRFDVQVRSRRPVETLASAETQYFSLAT